MVTDRQRKLVYWLVRLRAFRLRIGLFRTVEVVPRLGFSWLLERLLNAQAVDSLWHAPCCTANHWHKRRLVFQQCNCGAARAAQGKKENDVAATLKDIAGWFQDGIDEGHAYMIVVCDTFDHEDYPHYVHAREVKDFWSHYDYHDGKNMQRIMEVYDLTKPWSQQSQGRVMNVPERPSQQHFPVASGKP